jgi:hypothetical protein
MSARDELSDNLDDVISDCYCVMYVEAPRI